MRHLSLIAGAALGWASFDVPALIPFALIAAWLSGFWACDWVREESGTARRDQEMSPAARRYFDRL